MHIITEKRLKDFSIAHADSASSIRGWIRIVRNAKWQSIIDTRREWPSADPVGKFTIFNISGNKYRLVAYIDYTAKLVFVRHILTHEEYNKERWKNDPWY